MVPSDPLDGSLPDRHARSKLVIRPGVTSALCSPPPVLAGSGSKLRARPLSVPVEACFSMRPFTLLQRSLALRRVPAAGSTLLACIFKTALESPSARSASRSRPRPAFFRPAGRDHCKSPVANLQSQNPPPAFGPPLPSRTSRSFGIKALCPLTTGEAYHCELPDLPLLPAALQ